MSGLVLLVLGVLLCFFGIASFHLGVLAAGFGIGWFLARLADASTGTALLVGLGAAVLCWLVVGIVLRATTFVLGLVAGALIGARLYSLLSGEDTSVLLALVFVPSVAIVGGLLAQRYRARALVWATALAGASMLLSGAALLGGEDLRAIDEPEGAGEATGVGAVWLVLAGLGWWVQRRLFAKRLGLAPSEAAR